MLVGIAKLASESELREAKKQVEYFEIETRRYIGRCSGVRVPFHWTINPYRGCEFGCKYCYARYAHEFMELREPEDFERKIYVKRWDPEEFRRELRKIPLGDEIALGTATDPYQPAERRFGRTRQMLEIVATEAGARFWVTTKSDLVSRDVELLTEIARRHMLRVNLTITTLDEKLARALEPMAPRPALRIGAVQKLAAAGIRVGVLCCPVLPMLNDSERSIEAVARAAEAAGASHFGSNVLFLKPSASQVFLPFIDKQFPSLARRYRERFTASAFLKGDYPEMIHQRVEKIRERHGFERHLADYEPELWPARQLDLFA